MARPKVIPNPTQESLTGEMKVNKLFGTPYKNASDVPKSSPSTPKPAPAKKKPVKKMSPDVITKRKRTTVSNAAGRVMGGLYSK